MQLILEAILPCYLKHIQQPMYRDIEKDVINQLIISIKTLINNSEALSKYLHVNTNNITVENGLSKILIFLNILCQYIDIIMVRKKRAKSRKILVKEIVVKVFVRRPAVKRKSLNRILKCSATAKRINLHSTESFSI